MIGVTHIIAGLAPDGAERMLHRLVAGMDPTRFDNEVISLTDLGPMTEQFRASGIRVRALGMSRGSANPYYLAKLAGWLRSWLGARVSSGTFGIASCTRASISATRSGRRRPALRFRTVCRAGLFVRRRHRAPSTRSWDTHTIG